MIYSIEKDKLLVINNKKVLEKDVQKLIGKNLSQLLFLEFVEFEFSVERKRIDILAFDIEKNAPVIIELKRENAEGLFDQGMEYFNLLSDRKSDFMLKLHEKLKIPADIKKIDWENSRVVFIGKNFTQRQQRAVDFQGLPIELWEYEWYENDLFYLEQISLKKQAKLEINTFSESSLSKIKKEFREYDRDYHKNKSSELSYELFEEIEGKILEWDNTVEKFTKFYIDFKLNGASFCSIELQKKQIKITFGKKNRKIITSTILNIQDISNLGKWGNGDYSISISDRENILEILSLIKQSYKSLI